MKKKSRQIKQHISMRCRIMTHFVPSRVRIVSLLTLCFYTLTFILIPYLVMPPVFAESLPQNKPVLVSKKLAQESAPEVDLPEKVGKTIATRLYIPVSGNTTMLRTDSTETLLIRDYLGSIRETTATSSGSFEAQKYYPYGDTAGDTEIPSSTTDKGFTGHRQLADTGVYHAGARFYSPQLGVFVQADKIAEPNRYGYVKNNPVISADPSGHCEALCVIGLLGMALFAATTPTESGVASGEVTSGWNQQVVRWQSTGGPERSTAFLRMNPLIGMPAAAYELNTGQKIFTGEELSGLSQFGNVLQLAGGTLVVLPKINAAAGAANTAIQDSRIMAFSGAKSTFGESPHDFIQLATHHSEVAVERLARMGLRTSFQTGDEIGTAVTGASAYYVPDTRTIVATADDAAAYAHEAVHGIQHIGGHPSYYAGVRDVRKFFDIEIMANATTDARQMPFTAQVGEALGSLSIGLKGVSPMASRAYGLSGRILGSPISGQLSLGTGIGGYIGSSYLRGFIKN